MYDPVVFLLILLSILIGFLLGRWQFIHGKKNVNSAGKNTEYFAGLNYLLNEQTDETIEVFLQSLRPNIDNIEAYMIMGRLFRHRGEIEKAIQTHQDILARLNLTGEQSLQVRLELAHDYLKAGLLDRAESLLIELSQLNWSKSLQAVKSLLTIYEQEKEWQKAIDLVTKHSDQADFMVRASHYYAELANQYYAKNEFIHAKAHIKKSMALDRKGVRSILQMGLLEYTLGNYNDAVKVLKKIVHKNPLFLPESIKLLEKCYEHIAVKHGFLTYLSYCLKCYPCVEVIRATVKQITLSGENREAINLVTEKIQANPTLQGLDFLIEYKIHKATVNESKTLYLLKEIVNKLVESCPVYRCNHCGFEVKELHWYCPCCHLWGIVEPIVIFEGKK